MCATAAKRRSPAGKALISPLYERLLKPHSIREDVPVIPSSYEFDEEWDEPQCVAWLVTAPCKELKSWRTALRRRLKADTQWQENDHYSRLAGHGLDFLARRDLGLGVVDRTSGAGSAAPTDDAALIYSTTSIGVVLLDERERAIGYATFQIHWAVSLLPGECEELEVVLDEAWLSPTRRGEGLGTLMANAVVDGVFRHLVALEADWPKSPRRHVDFELLYTGDVYSTSGQAFMRSCWQVHQEWLTMLEAFGRSGELNEKSVDYDPRW